MYDSIFIGVILIIIGVVINRFNLFCLVAGYNTLSKENKEKYDIKSYTQFQEKVLVITGFTIISLFFIASFFDKNYLVIDIVTALIIIDVIILMFVSKKFIISTFSINRRNYIITILTVLFLFCIFYLGIKEPVFTTNKNNLTSNGIYSINICYSNIKEIKLDHQLPIITSRVNGFSFMGHNKGYFNSKEYGSVKLLINRNIPIYIYIITKNGDIYIINKENKQQTNILYNSIKELTND